MMASHSKNLPGKTILDELVVPGHIYNDINKVGDELDLGHYFIVFWCHQSLL